MSGPPISLVGLRGSGKTSVGRALASALACALVDLDEALVARWSSADGESGPTGDTALSPGHILNRIGLDAFRDLEERTLREVLDGREPCPGVLATGGGCVERLGNRTLLRERTRCVWLRAPIDVLRKRIEGDATERPPLLGHDAGEELAELSTRRAVLYAETAELIVEAGSGSPVEVARRVLAACR